MKKLVALLVLLLAPASVHSQELLVYMDDGFETYSSGLSPLDFPRVEADTASAWDGSQYTVPVEGLYDLTLFVWVEAVDSPPTYLGAQIVRICASTPCKFTPDADPVNNVELIGWDAKLVSTQFGSPPSYAATLHVPAVKMLEKGDHVYVVFFSVANATLSGYTKESWFSIRR